MVGQLRLCMQAAFLAMSGLLAAGVSADDGDRLFDIYSLHAEARGEVVNDLMMVELKVQGEHRESASLANKINATMSWALSELKQYPSIVSKTKNYNTWPKYDRKDNRIIGWHASQSLALETDDFDTARKAIQRLQEKLQVQNMQLVPKPATRESREDDLISDALGRFRERALTVQHTMGAADYRIVNVTINTNQQQMHSPRMQTMAAESSMLKAPAVAPGTSQVVVRVDGTIQLQ